MVVGLPCGGRQMGPFAGQSAGVVPSGMYGLLARAIEDVIVVFVSGGPARKRKTSGRLRSGRGVQAPTWRGVHPGLA